MKKAKKKGYKVTWYDAVTRLAIEEPKPPYKKLLAIKITVAMDIKQDKDVVILKTEGNSDDNEGDFTFIPKGWVKSIEHL